MVRIDMENYSEVDIQLHIQNLEKLSKIIGGLNHREMGWLYSSTRNAPNYQDTGLNQDIQSDLDHTVSGLSILYLFSLFEAHFPKTKERGSVKLWSDFIEPATLNELLAYRHIRHSIAHGFGGGRARDHRSEFDSLMQSAKPQCVICWDDEKFRLNEYGFTDLKPVMEAAISSALKSLYNGTLYV